MYESVFKLIKSIAVKVNQNGGESYFVGGCVRDKIMGLKSIDFDIEVHKISPENLCSILESITPFSEVGKSFGIYSLHEYPIDIALPRTDIKIGKGHRSFDISIDPFIGIFNATSRRDFTINSIMENILTGEIFDPFNGVSDIKKKIIRHTNTQAFSEDPLRVIRAAQYAARFNFNICEETVLLSKNVDLSTLSKERVFMETYKALLNSEKPSLYFEWLKRMNQLSFWFKQMEFLNDRWETAMNIIDRTSLYKSQSQNPFAFMLCSIVSHITEETDKKDFLRTLTNNNSIIRYVRNMESSLSSLYQAAEKRCDSFTTNLIFDKAIDKKGLILLVKSVFDIDTETEQFLNERLVVYNKTMQQPSVTGKDLIESGFSPGNSFSEYLKMAHEMRLKGFSKDKILLKINRL